MKATVLKVWISVLTLCFPLPAMAGGDVWAELSRNGNLKITGTDDSNQIMVTNDGFGNVRLVGMPGTGTTVRGFSEWTFYETSHNAVAGKLDINLKNGNNYVEIDDISVKGDLKIKLGAGDDTIGIFDAIFFDDVSIKLGDGNNLVGVVRVAVVDKMSVRGSSGSDVVAVAVCVGVGGKTTIKTGSGFDIVLLQGGYTGALKLDTGKGEDQLYISRYNNFRNVSINLGSDDDGIWVASTAVFPVTVKLSGANGTDTQTVAPTTIFSPKTKSVESFVEDPNTDAIADNISAAITTQYVARGGDPADVPCP